MRTSPFLPALALLLVLPARADESAASKAPAQAEVKETEVKKSQHRSSCCAGDEKVKCPRAKAAKPEAAGTANMVVTRDPETGEIRNATAAEREKLLGRRPQVAPAAPRVVILPDGTEMVVLGEDAMSYAVARRNPDGTVTQSCVEGPEAAAAARKPKADAPAPRADVR